MAVHPVLSMITGNAIAVKASQPLDPAFQGKLPHEPTNVPMEGPGNGEYDNGGKDKHDGSPQDFQPRAGKRHLRIGPFHLPAHPAHIGGNGPGPADDREH